MPKKLVRDKVPFLMRSEGLDPKVTVETGNRWSLLTAKLMEEAAELAAHPNWIDAHEEMADVREVFEALVREFPSSSACTTCGMPRSETLERAALRKREAKGGLFATQVLHVSEEPAKKAHDLIQHEFFGGRLAYILTTSNSDRLGDCVNYLLQELLGDTWFEQDDAIFVQTGHTNRLMVDQTLFDSLPEERQKWLIAKADGYALALDDY